VFEALMLVCGALGAALVGLLLVRQGAPPARVAWRSLLAGLAPLLLGPVVLSRFDLWPAFLTLAAVAALAESRDRLGFALLGLAVAAKIYPVVLVPLAVVHVCRRRGRREAGICIGLAAATVLVLTVPLLLVAPHGLWSSLSGQASRPLQLESLGASFLLIAHRAFGLGVTVVFSHGSNNVAGQGANLLAAGQTLLGIAAVVSLWIAYGRGPQTSGRLIRYSAACVCAFIAFGKVLSPQFLLWLVALVLLVPGRRGDIAAALLAVAMVVTQLWFPSHYISLAYNLDPRASWLVFARDLLLVALFATLAWPDDRAPRWRTATVGLVAGVAGLALLGAVASSSVAAGSTHTALLNETGVATTCGAPKQVPSVTFGSAAFATVTQGNDSRRPRCVWISVRSAGTGQLFAAAYAPSFAPGDPQTNYLGDAGICTNIRGVSGRIGGFSVLAPARTPLVVDVEGCSSDLHSLDYTVDVRTTTTPLAGFLASSAVRTGKGITFRWRVAGPVPGLRFEISRRVGAASTVLARIRASTGSRYRYLVHDVRLNPGATYFVTARSADGSQWESRGPLAPD
jgi:hypothetical protein